MVAIGVLQREGSLQLLFASLSLTFSTEALAYFSAYIIHHSVPYVVYTLCIDVPRHISVTSALSPFNLNTALTPTIFFIGVADIANTLST